MAVTERADVTLEKLMRCAPLGLLSAVPDGHFTCANPAAEALLGYTEAELKALTFDEITHPDDLEACRRLFNEIYEGKRRRYVVEKRFRKKSGDYLWARVTVAAICDARGRVLNVVGALEDITEAKRAADEAKRVAELVEFAGDAMIGADMETGAITSWNKGAEALFGYTAQEAVGRPATFHVPESRALETLQIRERLLRGEPVVRIESERVRKDGRKVQVAVTASLVRDASGKIVGACWISRDITSLRKGEEALQRLSAIVHSASDAVTGVDAWGRVTDWNEGAERLYGWKAADIVGRDIMLIAPPDRLEEANRLREEIRAGRCVEALETTRLRRDGAVIDVELTVSPVRDGAGRVIGSSGISHDITARKRAQEQIRRINAELETRVAERTQQLLASNLELESFNAAVSHDLRGPLSIMNRCLDLLSHEKELDTVGKESVQRARRSAVRMDRLIDDMMQLARCRGAPLRRERVDMTALARAVMAELRLREPGRRVAFVCAEGLSCSADRGLMKAALENLLGNAWKFTSKKPSARIEFGARRDRRETVFYVADDGAGFDMAYAPKLFRSFTRLHSQREFEGTGIGLSIVRSIVERHGGRIWASASVGRGATFFFTVP